MCLGYLDLIKATVLNEYTLTILIRDLSDFRVSIVRIIRKSLTTITIVRKAI